MHKLSRLAYQKPIHVLTGYFNTSLVEMSLEVLQSCLCLGGILPSLFVKCQSPDPASLFAEAPPVLYAASEGRKQRKAHTSKESKFAPYFGGKCDIGKLHVVQATWLKTFFFQFFSSIYAMTRVDLGKINVLHHHAVFLSVCYLLN